MSYYTKLKEMLEQKDAEFYRIKRIHPDGQQEEGEYVQLEGNAYLEIKYRERRSGSSSCIFYKGIEIVGKMHRDEETIIKAMIERGARLAEEKQETDILKELEE